MARQWITECLPRGPDTGGRLKSGRRLNSVRGVTTRTGREFECSRKSQTCPLHPSRNLSTQGRQLHHIRGLYKRSQETSVPGTVILRLVKRTRRLEAAACGWYWWHQLSAPSGFDDAAASETFGVARGKKGGTRCRTAAKRPTTWQDRNTSRTFVVRWIRFWEVQLFMDGIHRHCYVRWQGWKVRRLSKMSKSISILLMYPSGSVEPPWMWLMSPAARNVHLIPN